MESDQKLIEEILQCKKICVVGVSRKNKFGNVIFEHLKKEGYVVTAVNPLLESFMGDKCYPNLESIPEKPEMAILAIKLSNTKKVLEECLKIGLNRVFLVNGSYNKEILQYCKDNKIRAVYKSCPFLHFQSPGFHKFHKKINSFFSIKPRTI
jgi:uncharacterized protein